MFDHLEEARQYNWRVMEVRFRYDHLPMMRLLTGEILYIDVVLEKYGENYIILFQARMAAEIMLASRPIMMLRRWQR